MSNYQTDDFIKRLVAKYAIEFNKNGDFIDVLEQEYLATLI